MSDLKVIVQRAKLGLGVFSAALLLGVGAIWASLAFREKTLTELTAVRLAEQSNTSQVSEKGRALLRLKSDIGKYHELEQKGMVGVPDRTGWTEQFLASQKRLAVPESLSFTLQPAQPWSDQKKVIPNGNAEAATPDANKLPMPFVHDLEFQLTGTHEVEVLRLIEDYRAHVNGRFRVNACSFGSATPKGLTANCTLRFFTLTEVRPMPSKQ